MPYIKKDRRLELQDYLNILNEPKDVGELNYVITQLCRQFLTRSKASYSNYNSVIGVLECAKLEFYRRAVSPYEDGKIAENGDVY